MIQQVFGRLLIRKPNSAIWYSVEQDKGVCQSEHLYTSISLTAKFEGVEALLSDAQ